MTRKSDIGDKTETRLAGTLGAKKTIASGALEHQKSDLFDVDFRYESKATAAASMSIQHDWLMKISHEALCTNKQPALVFSFVNGDGRPKKAGQWVAIPMELFKELTGKDTL